MVVSSLDRFLFHLWNRSIPSDDKIHPVRSDDSHIQMLAGNLSHLLRSVPNVPYILLILFHLWSSGRFVPSHHTEWYEYLPYEKSSLLPLTHHMFLPEISLPDHQNMTLMYRSRWQSLQLSLLPSTPAARSMAYFHT